MAYTERYPERVEKLILISPVGVPIESEEIKSRRGAGFSVRRSIFSALFESGVNPCSALRAGPEGQGSKIFTSWTDQHMMGSPMEEKAVVKDYLYANCILPGSGDHCLSRLLTMHAYARKPTLHRIPNLRVNSVSFLYGATDWMDPRWALDVKRICQEQRSGMSRGQSEEKFQRDGDQDQNKKQNKKQTDQQNLNQDSLQDSSHGSKQESDCLPPTVSVYRVQDAGHMLLMENWREFNAGMIKAIVAGSTDHRNVGGRLGDGTSSSGNGQGRSQGGQTSGSVSASVPSSSFSETEFPVEL